MATECMYKYKMDFSKQHMFTTERSNCYRFTDVVAKWPGSQHDATIFENSNVRTHLEGLENSWLLGDSGYPLRKYLITPKLHPVTEAEVRFNTAHSRTRILVERAFGVLKSRFR